MTQPACPHHGIDFVDPDGTCRCCVQYKRLGLDPSKHLPGDEDVEAFRGYDNVRQRNKATAQVVREVVAGQLLDLTASVNDWHATRPEMPPDDLSAYEPALAWARRHCLHERADFIGSLYVRCAFCSKTFTRDDWRAMGRKWWEDML